MSSCYALISVNSVLCIKRYLCLIQRRFHEFMLCPDIGKFCPVYKKILMSNSEAVP